MDVDSKQMQGHNHDGTSPDFALDASMMCDLIPQVLSSAVIGG